MTHRRASLAAMVTSLALAGGSLCFGQAAQPDNPRGAPGAAQPAGQNGAAAAAHDQQQNAAAGKQVDQQIEQQLQKIQQQKDNLAGDRLFVINTAIGNQFEIALAQMAQQKAQDQNVKQLAQHILQDHQQAAQQLQQVAQKLQVEVPQGLPSMKQQELQIIGGMESKMFDQKFVATMDELHAKDVSCFRNTTQTAQSPDVKQFASQTLPKLQQHWQHVKQSAAAVGLQTEEAQPAGGRIRGSGSDTPHSTTPGSSGSGSSGSGSSSTPGAGSSGSSTPGSGRDTARPEPTPTPGGTTPGTNR